MNGNIWNDSSTPSMQKHSQLARLFKGKKGKKFANPPFHATRLF
jgi:hypothetical protein